MPAARSHDRPRQATGKTGYSHCLAVAVPTAWTKPAVRTSRRHSTNLLRGYAFWSPPTRTPRAYTCIAPPATCCISTVPGIPRVRFDTAHPLWRGMFVARVVGQSMEPKIPDGSYCLFKNPVTGTRQGRIMLVQLRDEVDPDTGERFTVKRYRSEKTEEQHIRDRVKLPHWPRAGVVLAKRGGVGIGKSRFRIRD